VETKKPLSFKDFLTVDYTPGSHEQISWNAKKRHRGVVGESFVDEEIVDEEGGLTIAGRRALGRAAKRRKSKLKMSRKRASKKTAMLGTLQNRSTKQVRNKLFKKFSKGKSRTDLSPARRKEIEKRLGRMGNKIKTQSRKNIPNARAMDRARKSQ
tara:strand:+ start:830 stop:1294 length:465 start_codon:yes stop_codon:yes gene_type:complete